MKKLFSLIWLLIIFISPVILAQELPPINTFNPIDYRAGNQNWMIDQDREGWMYFANNDGLLVFNGAEWTTYPSPNNTILRSVKVIDNRIYTGCYMEFGYWEKTDTGRLHYTSLSGRNPTDLIEDEQFWNITYQKPFILFQSLNRILVLNENTGALNPIKAPSGITRMFHLNNTIFFHSAGSGLFRIAKGKPEKVIGDPQIANARIAKMFAYKEGFLLITQQGEFFQFNPDTGITNALTPDFSLENTGIYNALALSNGNIAIGTISQGLFITDPNLKFQYHIDQSSGLSNNTILSLFEDRDHNLWLGLDNGVNSLNMEAPFKRYLEQNGKIGTVYTSAKQGNALYLGTNQGLFYKNKEDQSFKLVEGTKSQVWSLFPYDNVLFCGHDSGTFIIENGKASLISDVPGTWDFRPVPGRDDLLLQGNYNGFNVLIKTNGTWKFRNHIQGFDYSSKHFEITKDFRIYMSHEYKGIFELKTDPNLSEIIEYKRLEHPEKGKNSGLTRFGNMIYYANKEGVYSLNEEGEDLFRKDSLLSKVASGEQFVSGKMINDRKENLWLFTRDNLLQVNQSELSNTPRVTKVPIPYNEIRTIAGYEHVLCTGNGTYLVGSKDGYLAFDVNRVDPEIHKISLQQVSYQYSMQQDSLLTLSENAELQYKNNNIHFRYTVPEYSKYIKTQYQYQLSGQNDTWSSWSESPTVRFENLPFGKYTFKVRGRIGNRVTSNEATYTFRILPPWYFSNPALAIYFILLVSLAFLINYQYKRYYRKQQKKLLRTTEEKHRLQQLENEQELVKLRNEKLQQDVESKNRELAASTMSIIKKNEFLIEIRDNLKQLNGKGEKQIKSIIADINKDINEDDNWNLFKEAFNNADKDFLKKIKDLHPNLTPNDLRLCAYLRLNLSSKEIAPLLNISVRSVEIKRYRLRKKMELEHEKSLVEYILSV
ncbi:triple tyrosine motif-containing protein [Robertkochia flava]|uniref:triple tyrosine motif-containing protein n=1 Tax=Robertkochia flava TaxID=3447986 RepID=UPI001CCB20C1|nr:triple tyrosine motif-containing protein [Robertkochia marina]